MLAAIANQLPKAEKLYKSGCQEKENPKSRISIPMLQHTHKTNKKGNLVHETPT